MFPIATCFSPVPGLQTAAVPKFYEGAKDLNCGPQVVLPTRLFWRQYLTFFLGFALKTVGSVILLPLPTHQIFFHLSFFHPFFFHGSMCACMCVGMHVYTCMCAYTGCMRAFCPLRVLLQVLVIWKSRKCL